MNHRMVILVLFLALIQFTASQQILFGLLYNIEQLPSIAQIKPAVELAVDDLNNNVNGINPEGLTFAVEATATFSEADTNTALIDFVNKGAVAIIGPPFSFQSIVVAITGSFFKVPMISYSATSTQLENQKIYPFFMRTIPPDDRQVKALIAFVKHFGWTEVAIISTTEAFSVGLAQLIDQTGPSAGLHVLSLTFFTPGDIRLESKIQAIQVTGVRIVYTLMFPLDLRNVMYVGSQNDFTGYPYVFIGPDSLSGTWYDNEDGSFNKTVYDAGLGFFNTIARSFDETDERVIAFTERLKSEKAEDSLLPFTAFGYDAAIAAGLGLAALYTKGQPYTPPQLNSTDYLAELIALNFTGLSGQVTFDSVGDREITVYNIINYHWGKTVPTENFSVVAIYDPAQDAVIEKLPLVFSDGSNRPPDGTPRKKVNYYSCDDEDSGTDPKGVVTYDDYGDDPNYLEDGDECDSVIECDNWSDEGYQCSPSLIVGFIVIGILSIIGAGIILVSLLIIFIKMKNGRIRATGSVFLILASVSCFVGVLATFAFMGKALTGVCVFRYWMVVIPAGILIGSLCAKQYRIFKMFNNQKFKPVIVTNRDLLLITLAVLVPHVIILIIWDAVDTPTAQDDDGDWLCTSDYYYVFLGIIIGYTGVLLVTSSVLAFITRKTPSSFGEAKLIGFALYNATIISIIFIPLIFSLSGERFIQWILGELYIIGFFFFTYAILVFPKLYGVLYLDWGKDSETANQLPNTFAPSRISTSS